jgi:hypothetical protein
MFTWRKKRAPKPNPAKATRCDLCDRVSTTTYAVHLGENKYDRCSDHLFTPREWAIISGRYDVVRGTSETRGGGAA